MADLLGFEECPACKCDEPFNAIDPDDDFPYAFGGNCWNCDLPAFRMVGTLPARKGGAVVAIDPRKYADEVA